MSSDPQQLFDASYYEAGLGIPYRRDTHWLTFFDRIAARIVAEIAPASLLDAGCALGLLVEQLRARGVDAEGVDISEFAINSAHEAVRRFLRVGSVAEPFGRRYNLIVCIEVLEHMPRAEAERAVANLCAHSDDVLFSSSPLDYREPTHFNVQPAEYWAGLFAREGLFRDLDFDASFVTPWAVRFRRRADPPHRIVADYERHYAPLLHERAELRQALVELRGHAAGLEALVRARDAELAAAHGATQPRDAALAQARAELASAEGRVVALSEQAAGLEAYAHSLEHAIGAKDRHIAWLEELLRRVESGRVMRLLRFVTGQRAQRVRGQEGKRVRGQEGERVRGQEGERVRGQEGERASVVSFPALQPSHPLASEASALGPLASKASYAAWIAANEPDAAALERLRAQAAALAYRPLISLITPVFNPDPAVLHATIASVRAQVYGNWQLCFADGGSDPAVAKLLAAAADKRVQVTRLLANGGIAGNSNAALALASGEFVLILDHDDLLAPDALFRVAALLNAHPETDIIYYDEDKLSADGQTRYEPWFKPTAYSPDLLLATNYLMHGVFRRELVAELGGFDPAAEGAQDWDLALRATERSQRVRHLARVLYHWRAVPGSAARDANAKPYALAGQLHALAGHLGRTGAPEARLSVAGPGRLRVRWPVGDVLVSIVIPNRERAALLRACIHSIVAHTAAPRFELIIVDTGSHEAETLALYDELRADERVQIVVCAGPFNYSRANNFGAAHARGELLLFLNNDTEALAPDWLDELAGWALRPEIGIVGCKLVRPDGTIQHAGMAVGIEGHASALFDGDRGEVYGPFGSSEWARDLSAVTGACMLMRRDVFDATGGFDEHYRVGYSDIAICLQARALGFRVVYTPFARLLHHEGASRGFDLPPADVLRATMQMLPAIVAGDPYGSPNLSPVSRRPAIIAPDGETILQRLALIVENFGLVEGDVLGRLRAEAARSTDAENAPRPDGAPPRVLLASHELSLSGAPLILFDLARHLAAHGYAVTIAASRAGPLGAFVRKAGLRLEIVPRLYEDATLAYHLARKADLVLANTVLAMRVVHAARAAGRPCLWWLHEAGFGRDLAATTRHTATAFAAADELVFAAQAQAALYAEHTATSQVAVVPYGIAEPPPADEPPFVRRLGALIVAVLASIEPRKGQDVLLRALAAMDPLVRTRVDVYLVGVTIDHAFAARVATEAAALGRVVLTGEVDHARALGYLRAADLLVLPSRDDVLPISILEAMACAKPIVASAVGGVPELVVHGREALLFASEDHLSLAAHLEQLAADPALRAQLGQAARARFEAQFTRERFLNQMEALVARALTQQGLV